MPDLETLQKRHIKRQMDSVHKGNRSRKGTLKRLVDSVHEEKKPFGCTICGASFTQNVKLEGHLESVYESIGHIRTLSFLECNCDFFPS